MSVTQQAICQLTPELRCLNCMQEKGTNVRCPHCGYDERQHKNHPLYLKPRTLLKNQYLIGKCLGQGGFGITYTAFDGWLQKKVAIKEYLPATLATRDFVAATVIPIKRQEAAFQQGLHLFIEEAQHLARFDHPHIVRVIHFFEAHQTGYMVMEYLDGDNLTDVLLQHAGHRLPTAHALAIILPILDALATVHEQQLYHRDISLQNIRILKDGTPILIDFGAARHVVGENSQTLDLVLKHGYSPIEQYSGRGKIGAWTDIYACGALLYLLLTGRLPPAATDRLAGEPLIPLSQLLPETDIPTCIIEAIGRALALRHSHRFQTITQFKAALQGEAIPELPSNIATSGSIRRRILTVGLLGVLLGVGGALYVYHERQQQMDQWLQQAQHDWQQGRLLSPEGNNAYVRYQQVLEMEPNHPVAVSGLQQLARHYQRQAEYAYAQQDFAQALQAIQHGLSVLPTDKELLQWQLQLQQAQEQQLIQTQMQHARETQLLQQLNQARQAVAMSQLSEAVQIYQQILSEHPDQADATEGLREIAARYETLAREHRSDPTVRLFFIEEGLRWFPQHVGLLALQQQGQHLQESQQRIDLWLNQAEQHRQASRLTEPVGRNAYELYQKILQLQPQHPQALAGIQRIADQYEQLARHETRITRRQVFVDKGLAIAPTHLGLQNIQRQLSMPSSPPLPPSVSLPEKSPEPPIVTAPVTPVAPPPQPTLSPQQEWIQELLQQGNQALAQRQHDIATNHYQHILRLDAQHPIAKNKLTQIIQYYQQQAELAKQNRQWQNGLNWVNKGLAIEANHPILLTLRTELELGLKPSESPPKSVIFTPTF